MNKIKPEWRECTACNGTGYDDYDDDLTCENCEGEGRIDVHSLPHSSPLLGDRPRKRADTPRFGDGA